jgi:hypothetical protein
MIGPMSKRSGHDSNLHMMSETPSQIPGVKDFLGLENEPKHKPMLEAKTETDVLSMPNVNEEAVLAKLLMRGHT